MMDLFGLLLVLNAIHRLVHCHLQNHESWFSALVYQAALSVCDLPPLFSIFPCFEDSRGDIEMRREHAVLADPLLAQCQCVLNCHRRSGMFLHCYGPKHQSANGNQGCDYHSSHILLHCPNRDRERTRVLSPPTPHRHTDRRVLGTPIFTIHIVILCRAWRF